MIEIKKLVVARWKDSEKNQRKESLMVLYFHMSNYDIRGFTSDCPLCHAKNSIRVHNNRAGRYHCKDCDSFFYPLVPIVGGDK